MRAISGSVGRDGIATLGPVSCQEVTSQFAYIQCFYHPRTHQRTQDDTTEIPIAYGGKNLVVDGSVLWLSVALSFSSNQPAKEHA